MGKNLFSLQEVGSQLKLSLMYQVVPVADSWMLGPQHHTLNPFAYTHRRVGWWVVREGGSSGYNLPQAKLTSWVSGLMKVSQVIHSHL